MRIAIKLICALTLLALTGALAGCRTTDPEPPDPVLRPRQLPLATDMLIIDGEEKTSIAF